LLSPTTTKTELAPSHHPQPLAYDLHHLKSGKLRENQSLRTVSVNTTQTLWLMRDSEDIKFGGMRVSAQKNFQVVTDSRGFTLIELIMVVVLISILAVSVVPKFLDTSGFSLIGAASMAAGDIRYTQELAMGTHASKSIVFTSGNTYYTVGSQTVNLPSKVSISSGATFTFNSLGEPTAGGGSSVTLSAGAETKTITVDSYTGRVSSS
jgi:prepilin-type N-terminal cleavage/methylation domain-containing protein